MFLLPFVSRETDGFLININMISAKFYNVNEPNNFVNKTLQNETIINGLIYEPFDNLHVNIYLRTFNTFLYNYAKILDKYYFIDNVSREKSDLLKLELYLDVLQTYKEKILNCKGYITNKEQSNKFISTYDNITDVQPNFEKINFPNSNLFLTTPQIILITTKFNI